MKTRCLFLIKSCIRLTEPAETPRSRGARGAERWVLPGVRGAEGPINVPMGLGVISKGWFGLSEPG